MELNNIRFEEVNPTLVQHLYFCLCHIKKHWIWKTFPFLQNQLHLKNLTELIEGDLKDLEQAGVFYLDINTPGFWPLTITFWDFPCFFSLSLTHSLSVLLSLSFFCDASLWVHLWMEFPFPVVSLSSSNRLWYLMKDWSCCSPLDCC